MENHLFVLHAPPFRVPFHREKDRFTHQLLLPDGRCLLTSISSSNEVPWPPDPPLQQLVLEDIAANGNIAALGVGMSGHGHWSLAAEPIALPRPGVRFDWACRIHRKADRLSSAYRIDANMAVEALPLDGSNPPFKQLLLRVVEGGTMVRIAMEAGRIELDATERAISIQPEGDFNIPGTYRWCYTIAMEDHDGSMST